MTFVADTVRSHPRPGFNSNGNLAYALNAKKGYRDGDADTTYVAAPLTKGSATGEGVNQPGRRQEDDVNVVPYTFDWQMGGSWSGEGPPNRSWIQDTPGRARSLVKNKTLALHSEAGVRRLTPTECERLQGFPDGWTQLGDTADSKRYSALGDAVTVNVAEWIGRRLA